jgi:uncharacterized repeat protein (TIGR03803 family)
MKIPRNTTSSRWLGVISVAMLLRLISAGQVALAAQAPVDSAILTSVDAAQPAIHYKYEALYEFCDSSGCPDIPNGDLIFDTAGNLYGTTFEGGDPACGLGCGTVFQLSLKADKTWKLTTIFKFDGKDGAYPAAGLVTDAAGNLYGTTSSDTGLGDGTVFELSPRKGGIWKFNTLVKFAGKNGSDPEARLILDPAGNLYGTTTAGGNSACDGSGCGTVFELAAAKGKWKLTTLFEFDGTNGASPYADLTFDAAGNLYGTTSGGGKFGEGTVFKLSPAKGGAWKPTTLFSFNGADGAGPRGSVVFDAAGNLYGTTVSGGGRGFGTVFKLSPEGDGGWKHTTLVTFDIANGSQPTAGLIFDPDGNLYGNANDGRFGIGIVFRLSQQANGSWKRTTLLTFNGENGSEPAGGLLLDAAGDLYGSASVEGKRNGGVVFELSPARGKTQ